MKITLKKKSSPSHLKENWTTPYFRPSTPPRAICPKKWLNVPQNDDGTGWSPVLMLENDGYDRIRANTRSMWKNWFPSPLLFDAPINEIQLKLLLHTYTTLTGLTQFQNLTITNPTTHVHLLQAFSCFGMEALAMVLEVSFSLPELPQWHALLCILFHHLCHCHLEILLGDVHPSLTKGKHPCFCADSLQNQSQNQLVLKIFMHIRYFQYTNGWAAKILRVNQGNSWMDINYMD